MRSYVASRLAMTVLCAAMTTTFAACGDGSTPDDGSAPTSTSTSTSTSTEPGTSTSTTGGGTSTTTTGQSSKPPPTTSTTTGGTTTTTGGTTTRSTTTTTTTTGAVVTGGTATTSTTGNSTTTTNSNQPTFTPIAFAALPFQDNPGGNDPKAVALTFDDGPSGVQAGLDNTGYLLDQLKALNLHATFFVCGNVWTQVLNDATAQADIKRMVAEGHDIGNHTYDHPTLDQVSQTQVSQELSEELTVLRNPSVLGANVNVSMYRVPFGIPYQADNANVTWMAPLTAQYGVHIGWGIDSDDWKCAQNGQDANCIINNVTAQLDQGHSGVILMHAVYKLTADALPAVVQAIQARGYHIVMVQDFIKAKYGVTSDQVMQSDNGAGFSSAQISQAAQNSCGQNDFKIDPPY